MLRPYDIFRNDARMATHRQGIAPGIRRGGPRPYEIPLARRLKSGAAPRDCAERPI